MCQKKNKKCGHTPAQRSRHFFVESGKNFSPFFFLRHRKLRFDLILCILFFFVFTEMTDQKKALYSIDWSKEALLKILPIVDVKDLEELRLEDKKLESRVLHWSRHTFEEQNIRRAWAWALLLYILRLNKVCKPLCSFPKKCQVCNFMDEVTSIEGIIGWTIKDVLQDLLSAESPPPLRCAWLIKNKEGFLPYELCKEKEQKKHFAEITLCWAVKWRNQEIINKVIQEYNEWY